MRCVSGASAAQFSVCTSVLFALTGTIALAAEGCFQYGYGARQKAPARVGVAADSRDATAAALNPAGLVHVPAELPITGTVFSSSRGDAGAGNPGAAPDGDVASPSRYVLIPDMGQSGPIGSQTRAFCFGKTASFSNPSFSNRGTDVSWGGGVCAGLAWAEAPAFGIAGRGNSRVWMHAFERHRGLYSEQGDFGNPAMEMPTLAADTAATTMWKNLIKKKGLASIGAPRATAIEADVQMNVRPMTTDVFEYIKDRIIGGPSPGRAANWFDAATKLDIKLYI
jgi:hypothetical protein